MEIGNWLAIAIKHANIEGAESKRGQRVSFVERLEQALAKAGVPDKARRHGAAWVMKLGRFLGTKKFYDAQPENVEGLLREESGRPCLRGAGVASGF